MNRLSLVRPQTAQAFRLAFGLFSLTWPLSVLKPDIRVTSRCYVGLAMTVASPHAEVDQHRTRINQDYAHYCKTEHLLLILRRPPAWRDHLDPALVRVVVLNLNEPPPAWPGLAYFVGD